MKPLNQNKMTQKEFTDKHNIIEGMLETNTDFKMILLSNLSDLQVSSDEGYNPQKSINAIKEFIIDFYDAQPKQVFIDYN